MLMLLLLVLLTASALNRTSEQELNKEYELMRIPIYLEIDFAVVVVVVAAAAVNCINNKPFQVTVKHALISCRCFLCHN